MIKVYEYAGYINTGNGGNGKWYDSFPYKMNGSRIKPRTTFYDIARGIESSENWQAFVMPDNPCPIEKWIGDVPEETDYVTTFPIIKLTFEEINLPTLEINLGNEFPIREGLYNNYTIWKREIVKSFITKEGKYIYSLYNQNYEA